MRNSRAVVALTLLLYSLFSLPSHAAALDLQVSSGADDVSNRLNSCGATFTMQRLGNQSAPPESLYNAFRFQSVDIPQGATISANTYLLLMAKGSQASGSRHIYVSIAAENVDDASAANCSLRKPSTLWAQSRTSASVGWDTDAEWTNMSWYATAGIAPVIQEIVSRPGWSAGNSINILIADAGSTTFRDTGSYEYGAAYAPKLHVDYTTGPDTTPPARANGQPIGSLAAGTTETTIGLTTDEASVCRYSSVSGTVYGLMPNAFSSTGGTSHSTLVTGLSDGGSYSYYVRCSDSYNNSNTDDFAISFSVAAPDTTPPVISGISASATASSATVEWTTDDFSYSTVNYGTTPSFGSIAALGELVTSHSVGLNGLSSGTTYYYQVRSCNAGDYCSNSSTLSFDTTSPPSGTGTATGALTLVPSFENIAVYSNFTGDSNGNNQAILEYREAGGAWKQGIAMTADRRDNVIIDDTSVGGFNPISIPNPYKNQQRAVIFWLRPSTSYEVRVTYADSDGVTGTNPVTGTAATWNDNPASGGNVYYVAKNGNDATGDGSEGNPWLTIQKAANSVAAGDTVRIKPGTYSEQVTLSISGSASNYVTFRSHEPGNMAVVNSSSTGGTFKLAGVSYNKLKELDIRNDNTVSQAVTMTGPSSGNIVEDSNLSIAGSGAQWWSAAIMLSNESYPSGPKYLFGPTNTLIQRNRISTSSVGTNGLFGVLLRQTGGGTVIRYNTITGAFYDGIGGGPNFGVYGGPHRNGYIYGNAISGAVDDGMEVEGGGINVGVWNNTITSIGSQAFATGPVIVGPQYVFRNVVNMTTGQSAVKMGSSSTGFLYFYHNTFLSRNSGIAPSQGSDSIVYNAAFRNNIIEVSGGSQYLVEESTGTGTMDFDYNSMYSSRSTPIKWLNNVISWAVWRANYSREANGIWGQSVFVDPANNNFRLSSSSPNIDKGVSLAGFNDANSPWAMSGALPDMGAFEYDSGYSSTPTPTPPPATPTPTPTPTPASTPTPSTPGFSSFRQTATVYASGGNATIRALVTFAGTGTITASFAKPAWASAANYRVNESGTVFAAGVDGNNLTWNADTSKTSYLLFDVPAPVTGNFVVADAEPVYQKNFTVSAENSFTDVHVSTGINFSYGNWRLYWLNGTWVDATQIFNLTVLGETASFYGLNTSLQQFRLEGSCPDSDNDGFYYISCNIGTDCNDNNAGINPNAADVCGNGIDEDCSVYDAICAAAPGGSGGSGGGGGGGGSATLVPVNTITENVSKEIPVIQPEKIAVAEGDISIAFLSPDVVEAGELFDMKVVLKSKFPTEHTAEISVAGTTESVTLLPDETREIPVTLRAPIGKGNFSVVATAGKSAATKVIGLDFKPLVLNVTKYGENGKTKMTVDATAFEENLTMSIEVLKNGETIYFRNVSDVNHYNSDFDITESGEYMIVAKARAGGSVVDTDVETISVEKAGAQETGMPMVFAAAASLIIIAAALVVHRVARKKSR